MDFTSPIDDHADARLGVLAALMDGDAALAFHQVLDLMSTGIGFDTVLFDILVPIQSDVGRRWAGGDYNVADEHAISAALETVIALLAGSFEQPADGPLVVVAAAEGDLHSLPSRVIAAYLTYRELRVANLGATLPAEELEAYLGEQGADALVLSCSMAAHLVGARRCIAAAHRAGVPVVAGGNGFGSDRSRAERLGADAWLANPRLLDGLLTRWEPDIEAAEAQAAPVPSPLLAERYSDIGAIAEDVAGTDDVDARERAALRIEVEAFAATIDASRLLADAGPITSYAKWHAAHLAARRRPARTARILEAFATRLEEWDPAAAAMVRDAAIGVE